MDVFLEQIVARKNTGIDVLKKLGIVLAAVVISVFAFLFLPQLVPVLASLNIFIVVGASFGAWYLITSMNVEYEYILTNGEIDVDKIIARRKRKRLITVNTRQFTAFGPYRPQEHANESYASTIMACSSVEDPNTYYAVSDHAKFGKCILIFNPNEKIVENIKQFVKRNAVKS